MRRYIKGEIYGKAYCDVQAKRPDFAIDVLREIWSGVDVLRSQRSFDVVLVCKFDSMDDMEVYRTHEVHMPIMEYVKSVVEKSHSVDCVE